MEPFEIIPSDTIAAVATPSGTGGIAVFRVSGPRAIQIVNSAWEGKNLGIAESHTAHLGKYFSSEGRLLDECVVTIFRNPRSFTGEDVVEIAVHGSKWIQRELLADLIKRGARIAGPGEFTQRAFLNGKMDLAQAEGVADLIAASSRASHELALKQTKGAFSGELENLRDKLIEFASLMELELDFSEEDVEFANRQHLLELCNLIKNKVDKLAASYSSGAVMKDGIPVAIAGMPNAGKSSLLNLLLGDEKAIVTDIPGTTRDTIEDTVEIDGLLYRFIDTAGLRLTDDIVESKGIERARKSINNAYIVIWVIDSTLSFDSQGEELNNYISNHPEGKLIILLNKSDLTKQTSLNTAVSEGLNDIPEAEFGMIRFSTKTAQGLEELKARLKRLATDDLDIEKDLIVTNARHYEALVKAADSLQRVEDGLRTGISGDFISQDIRETLHHLALITGAISTDNLLHSIFSRFCIGK